MQIPPGGLGNIVKMNFCQFNGTVKPQNLSFSQADYFPHVPRKAIVRFCRSSSLKTFGRMPSTEAHENLREEGTLRPTKSGAKRTFTKPELVPCHVCYARH